MATFPSTPAASQTSARETKANISLIQFGDGYSQRIPTGVNNLPAALNVYWKSLTYTERDTLATFLQARNGVESFEYTIPGEATAYRYFCRSWKESFVQSNLVDFSATFEQVFEV